MQNKNQISMNCNLDLEQQDMPQKSSKFELFWTEVQSSNPYQKHKGLNFELEFNKVQIWTF